MKRLFALTFVLSGLLMLAVALAGGTSPGWQKLNADGRFSSSPPPPVARPCPPLRLPRTWDVRSSAYADVTGDGVPECVLSVWRPWRDWPLARWSARPTPITGNRDTRGQSSHIAVLRPLGGGRYREIWVGSALYQPVTTLTALPDGRLLTLETTYARGRSASSVALSLWRWTGFGFLIERRVKVQAFAVATDELGGIYLR